ncbi:MAG: threonine synthase [Akkermansiaceae bacterium]|nr:threonine synthase [Akkermansiaceae bacterium]MCF7734226.1 threonine synthase [Akkermansiaceae bacterium]
MRYLSTNDPSRRVSLKEAVLDSLPPDHGLYLPERLPVLDAAFWRDWRGMSFEETGVRVAGAFFGGEVPEETLAALTREALSFDAPLVPVTARQQVLELFHGPTLAFKDFGARFMARLMGWLARDDEGGLTVLVATSGDTGGAVAHAFHGVPGIRVVILYPSGKVSGLQEKQLTALGGNISALEVDGTFDDCQRLVKAALLDPGVTACRRLTSANSINIARLVPQTFYYIHGSRQLAEGVEPVFVVPSGNLGNLTAGLLAERMGLRVRHFVAALNRNDAIGPYLAGAPYQPRPSVPTLSNAMDVGAPSNFARLLAICGHDHRAMVSRLRAFTVSDGETLATIREVAASHGYQLDPHGAVGWHAATRWLRDHPDSTTIILETAHPAKFPEVMDRALGPGQVLVPERLARVAAEPKVAQPMSSATPDFLAWLKVTA